MNLEHHPSSYDRLLDLIVEKATLQEILQLAPTSEEQQHADDLRARAGDGTLTQEEVVELAQSQIAEQLLQLLMERVSAGSSDTATHRISEPIPLFSPEVYTLAHDLKTPISVILGYAELAQLHIPGEQNEQIIEHIIMSAHRMTEMINALFTNNRDIGE